MRTHRIKSVNHDKWWDEIWKCLFIRIRSQSYYGYWLRSFFVLFSFLLFHVIQMQIFVKTTDVDNIALEVESSDTIDSIKARVEERHGMPQHLQFFSSGGRRLEDHRTFAYYKIGVGCAIWLGMRLLGGPPMRHLI